MYKFMISFLAVPYEFFTKYTADQYAKATWVVLLYVGVLAFCLISLSTMCERMVQ